jgi:hypothetical protein
VSTGNSFPFDMDPFALDAGTAERLITGAVLVADAPPDYRPVAGALQALRDPPGDWEFASEAIAVDRIAAAVVRERQASSRRRSLRRPARVAALATIAAAACALPLTGALAAAAALPEPAQDVASAVLDKVGISVPTRAEDPADERPPATTGAPTPPSTNGSNPGTTGPAPDVVATSPPDLPGKPDPGNGQGDPGGTRGHGPSPNKPGQGGAHTPKDPPTGGNGNGHRQ